MSALGDWLKQARQEAGLRHTDVVNKAGVPSSSLSMIEQGKYNPNGHLEKLCELYGVNPADAPQYRRPRRKSKKAADGTIHTDRDRYIQIAKLAAEIGDMDIALTALAKIESD